MRKNVTPNPPYIEKVSMLPIEKLRRRNRPSGSIGSAVRLSCTRKAASRMTPASAGPHTGGQGAPAPPGPPPLGAGPAPGRPADQPQPRPRQAKEGEGGAEPVHMGMR